MPNNVVQLQYFRPTVDLDVAVGVRAGTSASDAIAGRYQTRDDVPSKTVSLILRRLATAIDSQAQTIPVAVENDKWIVG